MEDMSVQTSSRLAGRPIASPPPGLSLCIFTASVFPWATTLLAVEGSVLALWNNVSEPQQWQVANTKTHDTRTGWIASCLQKPWGEAR